jgi:hypothetical protein
MSQRCASFISSPRELTQSKRAGANFSAISGDDANALRWDKLGYGHMMKLAEEHGVEACISKTPSFEYWDEMPARAKIDSMAEYLKDVCQHGEAAKSGTGLHQE